MDFYADVLDHIGKTPREFGSVQVHLESVTRAPGSGQAVATLLFQAAFEPAEAVQLRIYPGSTGLASALANFVGPPLPGGAVVRGRFPFRAPEAVREIFVRIEGQPPPAGSERVRPAWMLHDTHEVPKLSEMEPGNESDFSVNVTESLVRSALSGGVVVSFSLGRASASALHGTTHKARQLPPGFGAEITEADLPGLSTPVFERLWSPGDPLPSAATDTIFHGRGEKVPPAATIRRCFHCGFEGSVAEYERARFCPNCDAVWG